MTQYSLLEANAKQKADIMNLLTEQLQQWIGRTIEAKIQLTKRFLAGEFDQQGTTNTYFEFKLTYVDVSLRGGKLMLLDDKNKASLEAFTDIFVDLSIEEDKVIFVEKHKGDIGRQITLIPK